MKKAPPQIEDHGDHIVKREDPAPPEAEKYRALNAAGAPVVRLLDVRERDGARFLVLEKAAPLFVDTNDAASFARVRDFLVELARSTPSAFPTTNWAYIEHHWSAASRLISFATENDSPIHEPKLRDCPPPAAIFSAYRELVAATRPTLTHGDPANSNLGLIRDRIVAFDLQLTWAGEPFRDLALRTGASVMPFPATIDPRHLCEDFAAALGINVPAPRRAYRLSGAIYGTYFEHSAVDDLLRKGRASPASDWARLTLNRYIRFTSQL